MSRTSVVTSLLVIGAAACSSTAITDRRDLREVATRTAISDEVSRPGSKCPISQSYVQTLDYDVLSICVAYGLTAMDAARRYPETASKVFALYGEDPIFRSVFDQYGPLVVPIIGYFVENGSNRYRFDAAFQGAVQRVWQGRMPAWGDTATGEQMGYMAVQDLEERGSEVLAEFEIVDGRAKRKSIEATVLGTKNLVMGGIHKLETVWARGNTPTWKDYGGAALDVAVVAGGIGMLAKEARVAEVAVGRSSPRAVAANATAILRKVGTIATGPIGNVAILYIVVTHPTLLGTAVGWAAEQLGLNGPVCIFFAYLLLFQVLYLLFRPFFWIGWQMIRLGVRATSQLRSVIGARAS
ncbi:MULTISPECIES: hypothetical protein [unclassified Bradyrhizobium]|uniref:hypothetical protein n=1 Tax=unclassified Bradyrhizobium TaxID=2631580 RepID=UPI002916CA0A|nr:MULTISPECIES: hypothetical protein [unclassified Bradyrhizobium]